MPRYLISFDAHAMDHIPDEDMPAVARAAHEMVSEAMQALALTNRSTPDQFPTAGSGMTAGVWVFGGGLENQKASIVPTDGTVTDGPYPEAIGGFYRSSSSVRTRSSATARSATRSARARSRKRRPSMRYRRSSPAR